jgi:type I restriction enzyme S subunit
MKYQSYKPSKIDWIGEIPTSWEVRKFRFLFVEKKSTQNLSLNSGSISFGQVIYKNDEGIPQERKETYQEVLKGEFLLNPLNLNFDLKSLRIGLSEIDVVVSPGYIVLKLNEGLNKGYFKYLLRIFDTQQMKSLGNGVRQTISFKHLSSEELVLPTISEQQQIVQFLDEKTDLIDRLISTKELKISLLKEQRTSIISKVVTKGLNPKVKMKDSGVEWIGDVPEDWKISKLGFYTTKIGSGSTPKGGSEVYPDSGIPFIRSQNVHFDGLRLDDVSFIDIDTHLSMKGSKVNKNDILLNITGGSIGRCCVVDIEDEMNVNQHVSIIRTKSELVNYFLNFILCSDLGQSQVRFNLTGGNREGLTIEGIRNFIITIPSITEQNQIIDFLISKTKEIDDLVQLEQKKIDLLKEYRQSLISEVVTGKVKVTQ